MVIPQGSFIYISVFIIAIYLIMMIVGYMRGLLYELIGLFFTVLAVGAAWFSSPVLANLFPIIDLENYSEETKLLSKLFDLNQLINTIAYFLIVFLLLKLLYFFVSLLLKSLNKVPVIGTLNRFLGSVFGMLNATIIVLCLSMLLSLPIISNGKEVRENTVLKYISRFSSETFNMVADWVLDSNLKEKTEDFDIDLYREEFREWLMKVSGNE